MNIVDFLSPLFRRKFGFIFLFLGLFAAVFGASQLINNTQKSTLYFSVKPINDLPANNHYYAAEGAERIAEMMSGWIKNPAFRNDVQTEAGTSLGNFRKKVTARKQNRINVFATLSLPEEEAQYSEKIINAVYNQFTKRLNEFNQNNAAQYELLSPTFNTEVRVFPLSWFMAGALIIAFSLAVILLYVYEALADRVSFITQVREQFPTSPLLRINKEVGKHDEDLLTQFISSAENPLLIGTFKKAFNHFSLENVTDVLNTEGGTPILIVKLGETQQRELENLHSLFGENLGIIVFEK